MNKKKILNKIISNNFYYILKILIPSILLVNKIYFYKKYNYCLNCYKYKKKSKCSRCPKRIIFFGLKIVSDEITLNEIIKKKKSISRFGDGEFKIIFGGRARFQHKQKLLSKKLIEVLNSDDNNFLIGLNIPFKNRDLNRLTNQMKKYWKTFINKYKWHLAKLINKNRIYHSATISRFYMRYKDKNRVRISKYIKKVKKIWNNKNILIIEGQYSRLGIGNDLFDNVKTIKRIICPYKNAFSVYDKIIEKVIKIKEKRLILIALGPTATVLSYDLYKLGYQSIDIGHIDIEYEWFLRNCKRKIQIKNKYVSEAKNHKNIFTKLKDKEYNSQILFEILN